MNNNPYKYEPLYTPGTYTSNVIDSATGEFDIKAPEHKLQEPTSFEPTMLEPTNNAFIPIVDDGEDSSFTRLKGLQAYVTADMKPERKREAKRIFGNIPKYAHDHYSNMYVGRAIASSAGMADSPELLFKNPAYAAQGYKLPNAWSDRNQLYAAIGSQFATMEREKMQRTLTEEQAILKEREKDPKALSQAILNAVTRSSVSPADRVMLEYNGITPQTIQKVHAALVLFGQQADKATRHTKHHGAQFVEDKSAEQTSESDIDSTLIAGGRDGWFGENLVNPYSAYNVADLMGDDKMARGLFLELVAMAGRNKRMKEQGHEWSVAGKTLLNESVARLGYAIDEWFMTKPDVPVGADADIINDRRNAMLADIRKYYEAGYADTDNRIGFSLARVPVAVSQFTSATVGYMNPAGWIAEASDMGQKYIDEAAANIYNTDPTNMEASWWERKGAAGAKTAVFSGAIIATGGLAKWAGPAIAQRFAPNLAKRVAGSKALTYGTRVVEGTTTEALEELNNAIGQELLEGVNLIADRQKQENMTQLWKTWTSPEFWSANVGMNMVFGLTGYKGSRSKAPYKSVESLVKLGFSKKEAQSVTDRIQTAIGEGQSQAEVSAILAEEIRKKSLENPQATGKKMIQAAIDLFRRREIEDSAANGVREALLKEANVTDYTKDEDGNYTLKAVKRGADGKFESVEMKLSEDELNNWLTTEAATHITQEILRVQALVRGEQAATAAAKLIAEGKSPFERVAYLTDAPVEVLAKLKGKDTFDAETIAEFTKYAVDEINRRMAGGETREQAESAEFGTTGASLGAISRLSDQYSEREGIEVHSGNIEEGALTESAAFILPGKSVGDNILMLARGQVTASEVAHDWLEGFARSRFYSDRELWSNRLDALDRELLQRGIIPKSLFKSPEGSRKDIEYIEALNHLTEQRWLVDHEAFNMTDASNALLSEMLEELSAVQNGLALAGELKNWMDSEEGKQALADKGALHKLFAEAGSSLADLMAEAEQVAPKTAADFVLKHRERMLRELDELANLVESPQAEAPPPTESDVTLPDGETVTAAEIASVNGIDSTTGELSTPPLTAYTSVKAPKGAGRGLNGGIAHRMRDGSVEGASKLSTLNLHASVADADLAKANGSIADPVIVYRHRDGKMEVIGGFARYHHDKSLGVENTHVKVFGAGKKHPANWAADKARANKIKEGVASVADIIRHMQKHGYTRNAARKLNLIPKLTTGEHPASRAAWLLMQHATKKELKNLLAGNSTTREALASIADKVDTLDLEQQGQATASFSMRTAPAKPMSATDAQKEQLFDSDGVMRAANAIVTTPTASFSIRAMHVSPHKFRKFSTDFMGSGEGAQAYGWGLYFMTNEDINKHYWRQFKKVGNKTYYDEGVEISKDEMLDILTRHFSFSFDKKIATSLARHLTNSASHSLADAVADMKENAHRWCDNYDEERDLRNALDSLIEFGDLDFKADVSYPSNYRVEINADDTNMLMWDTLIDGAQATPAIREIIDKARHRFDRISFNDFYEYIETNPSLFNSVLENISEDLGIDPEEEMAASEMHKILSEDFDDNYQNLVEAKEELEKAYSKNDSEEIAFWTQERKTYSKRHRTLKTMLDILGGEMSGEDFYRHLSRELRSDKAASMWLLEQGYKGIKYLDGGSRAEGEGTYNYVIFSGDDIKITEVNESGAWSMDEGWEPYTDPTASFSIRTKGKRKYSTLDQLHNNELLRMFLDEALQLQQESIRFLDRDSNINDVTRTAAEIRGLLSAMYKVIPKEARPWKTLKDLPDRVRTLSYAALNPHEQLDVQDAPGMHPDEVIRYNQLTVDQRMLDIASKLARASTALIRAMARSTEAYLCRAEIERADKAIRALEPKLQKSGKERRGLTSEIVYKKAHQWYKMMDWSDQRIQEEAQKAMAVKAKPEATQDDIDNAEKTLKAILLFGGLRRENLERTRTGVQFLLDFISTGRATWEAKLTAERRAIEAPQIALANLLPKVDQSYLNNKDRKASLVGKAMEGNMNITQLLDAGSAMQGPVGKFFADWRDQMALALDAANYDIQQEQRNLEKVLSEILQKHGKKGNDIGRSQFIADCQQVHNTGAVRKGVIKVTRYEFEAKDIEDFAKIREEQGEEAFKEAVHTRYKSANTKEDLRKDEMPYEAAWQDALSQAQSPYYRGGKIYVDHYGPRDTDHVAPLELTRMQAANLVMMADQPSYANQYDDDGKLIKRGTMDINGYTEDVIARLEAYAGPELMALARYMRDTYNHTGLFAAYAEYMGLPFPAEENYWPGMFDQPTSGQMVDALDASRSGNGVFDMLIKRREHISPPDIKLGLYDVWSNTIQQHYNYVHLSPLTRKLRRFLRDRDTYARMCEAVGKSAVDNMIALLDTVDGAAGLQLRAQHAWNKLLGWYQGKQALLLLSGATSSAIKQTTGILNALAADGITPLNLIPYIMKSVGFGHKTPADMMKLKVFQNRVDRDSLTNRAFRLEPDQKMGKWGLDMGTVLGMRWFMERPDAWVNSISMAAVYNQEYDNLANAIKATEGHSGNLSPEEIAEIEKQCEAKVSQVMHRAAQPMEKTDKGAVMQQNNAAVSQIFYMAGESLVKIGLVMNRVRKEQAKHASDPPAARKMQFLRSAFTAWRTILPFSCANQLILTLLAAANGSMPDDDEERIQWLTSQAIAAITGFGMLNIVPVLGDIVSAAGQWAFGSYGAFATFGDSGVGIDPRIGKQIDDALEKEGWERIYAIANLTRSIGTVAGMGAAKGITGMATVYAILSGIGTLFNASRPIIQRFRNNERDEKKKSKKKSPLIIPT